MADEMQSLRPPASRCPTGSKLQAGFFRLVLPRGVCRPRRAEGLDHEEATPCEHHSRPPGTASGSRQCRRDSIWNPTLGYPQGNPW